MKHIPILFPLICNLSTVFEAVNGLCSVVYRLVTASSTKPQWPYEMNYLHLLVKLVFARAIS